MKYKTIAALCVAITMQVTAQEVVIGKLMIKSASRQKIDGISCANGKFSIIKNGKKHAVNTYDVSPLVRGLASKNLLGHFMFFGYFSVNSISVNGMTHYGLHAHLRSNNIKQE